MPMGAEKARKLLDGVVRRDADWLFVFGNVPDAPGAAADARTDFMDAWKGWLPNSARARVIATSRRADWPGAFRPFPLDVLPFATPGDPAPRLLMREAGRTDDPSGARALAEALGGLPLALVTAGSLIRVPVEDDSETFVSYATKLDAVLAQTSPDYTGAGADYPASVLGAVQLSYDRLPEYARAVMDLLAWFAAEGLTAPLLTAVPAADQIAKAKGDLGGDCLALLSDPARVAAALRGLAQRSLLVREDAGFALHWMTGAAVRALQGDRRLDTARAAAAFLAAQYPAKPSISEKWPACRPLTPHAVALARVWPGLPDAPAPSASADYLFNQTAVYLSAMAEAGPAVDLAEAALPMMCARLPAADPDIATGYSVLGNAYLLGAAQGPVAAREARLGDAVDAQAEAVRLTEAHGHDRSRLATFHNNHAGAMRALGLARRDRALVRAAQAANQAALQIKIDVFGRDSEQAASSLAQLALVRNAEWFVTTHPAQLLITAWFQQYARIRPDEDLGMLHGS